MPAMIVTGDLKGIVVQHYYNKAGPKLPSKRMHSLKSVWYEDGLPHGSHVAQQQRPEATVAQNAEFAQV